MRRGGLVATMAALAAACASAPPPRAAEDTRPKVTGVELARFEVRAGEVDRFEHCPPPGEIGQDWVPPLPEWQPSTAATDASAGYADEEPATLATLTARAIEATRAPFRRCYHQGLIDDPTQDGHVAVVMRVDRSGHVARVETWGACDIAPEAIACMRDAASHVRLRPPADGFATVMVPAVFTSGAAGTPSPNDAYAASAYVAIESMRPRLHACESAARASGASPFAGAVMTIDLDAKGKATHVGVDQWKGDQPLLGCAAEALQAAPFAPPPAGRGKIVVPIVFNPRRGTL